MATYFDKKKLLNDNSDLYISEYDKSLGASELAQIIDAKKAYSAAHDSGDTSGMKKANTKANSIREKSGAYNGGADGSEYNQNTYREDYEKKPSDYSSKYSDEKKKVQESISKRAPFNYKLDEDPLYQTYKKIYSSLGDDAYDRALGEKSLRTGGMANTNAQSAAMQAKNKFNALLAQAIPELYKLAYTKYTDEGKDLYEQLNSLRNLEGDDYKQYRDSVSDYGDDRDYFYSKSKDASDKKEDSYNFDTNLEYNLMRDTADDNKWVDEFGYKRERDNADDSKWLQEFNYGKEKDLQDSNDNKLNAAISLAKSLYGKYPYPESAIKSILSMMQ